MKSAGSSHSNAVMNSWSSMPNEYVVWLWIVANSAPMRMCSSIARCRSSGGSEYHGRTFTNGYTTRYGDPFGTTFRARLAFVYCDSFVVARYEYGVSSHPASGVALSAAPSSPRSSYRSVIFHRKKSQSGRTPVHVYAWSDAMRPAHSST